MNLFSRIRGMPRELKLFIAAILMMSIASSIYDSTFNNFLNERFALTGFQRSFLEVPRELPGFLVVFISAALWFLCSRRLGAFALLCCVAGVVMLGFIPAPYGVMTLFIFTYSLGQHLFMPLASTITMELAHAGRTGQRLGQFNAIRNLAVILGSFVVFMGFRYLHFSFKTTFLLTAIGMALAAGLMFKMKPDALRRPKNFLSLHKEYRLYYLLNILTGMRKQIFFTFAPWVIVTVFEQPTQTLATLLTIGGVIGILFQPLLGRAIDRFGERIILMFEAVLLAMICLGYALARSLFPTGTAFILICIFYLVDQMLMSVNMARSMYMKKIALQDAHVQPALTAGLTIDHFFSIGIAVLGGFIWNTWGYEYVFLLGVGIAVLNFLAARLVRLPAAPVDASRAPG